VGFIEGWRGWSKIKPTPLNLDNRERHLTRGGTILVLRATFDKRKQTDSSVAPITPKEDWLRRASRHWRRERFQWRKKLFGTTGDKVVGVEKTADNEPEWPRLTFGFEPP